MNILAIDTSSKNASVAITQNEEKLIEINNNDEKTHSQKLMPMIDEALQKTGLSLNEIGLIACCLGPGSFTGVRIGIATAKAFADSKNIVSVGVNSLEELSYNLNTEGYVCSLLDAGHGNTYAGFFKIKKDKNGRMQTIYEDLAFLSLKDQNEKISSKKLVEFIEKNIKKCEKLDNTNPSDNIIYFVGDATVTYKELIEKIKFENLNNYQIKISNDNQNIASGITLAKIGYTKYKNGQYGDSSILRPVYLRKSQAELALEENNRN